MKDRIDDTSFTFGPSTGFGPDYTDVTDTDGVTHDDVNMCIKESLNFINKKLSMCSQPIDTSKIRKLVNGTDVIYQCRFMLMVTSTGYPFVLGLEADIKNGKLIRASTQDIYRGDIPLGPLEDNFKDFSEVETFKVYSR
tara:strand:+ start:162 stop:578 length:417 start_codon:yes stop_codon:yes gene_type:complete